MQTLSLSQLLAHYEGHGIQCSDLALAQDEFATLYDDYEINSFDDLTDLFEELHENGLCYLDEELVIERPMPLPLPVRILPD